MRANIMYYHIYLYHGNKCNYHCVITQTLQNGQTLGQFFELLYFQPNKSNTIKSYKQDEALIKTHSGQRIKFSCSD